MVIIGNHNTPPSMSVWIALDDKESWVQLQEAANL